MVKKTVSTVLVAMMLLSIILVPACAESFHTTEHTVSLVPGITLNETLPDNCVLPGDTFTMSIKITDEENVGFYSTEIILTYDNSLFTCELDTDNDGKLIYRYLPSMPTTPLQPSDWTCPRVYEFKATTDDIDTTTSTFSVKANIIETAEDAFKDGNMAVSGSCDITIVKQFNVTYYDTEGNKITSSEIKDKVNQDEYYEAPEVEPVSYHHYRWTIDDEKGEYKTSEEVNSMKPTADSDVYLHLIPNTYEITVEGTETATIASEYQYDGTTDLEGTIDNYDARYDYTVTYSIVDTPFPDGITLYSAGEVYSGEADILNGNTFFIPAQFLKGPVELTISKTINVEIEVTDFVAGTNGTGWYLVKVFGGAEGYTFAEAYGEEEMYSYAGYTKGGKASKVWLTQALTPETANFEGVFAKLNVTAEASESIQVVNHDLNQDGVINFKDATLVNAAYIVQWSNVQENITRYIQADVNKDGALNSLSGSDTNAVLSDANYTN